MSCTNTRHTVTLARGYNKVPCFLAEFPVEDESPFAKRMETGYSPPVKKKQEPKEIFFLLGQNQ